MKIGYTGQEQDIPRPVSFKIDYDEISKTERAASGKLLKEIIAIKKKFTLTYDSLDKDTINMLENLFLAGDAVNFIYDDAGATKSATVYIDPIPREVFLYKTEYSRNITITFKEM